MMRSLTAVGCITYAPVYIRPNFAGGRSRLDFLLLLFPVSRQEKEKNRGFFIPCQDKRRRRTRALPLFPVSRQEEEKNRGFAPLPPPSFLPLMEEKKAKEDQGVRDAGQVFRVPGQTSLPRQGTSWTPAKFSGYVRELDNLFFHNAQRQLRIDGAQQPHRGEDVAPI